MLAAVTAVGLASGFASCSDDNDIPFLKSDLHSFGPSPAERGKDITILGKHLDKVNEVVFPVNVSVKEFTSRTDDKITVTVPQEAVPGQIKLVMNNGDVIVSRSTITFIEEIEVTSVAPLKVSAGDKVTVTGKFLYNVASVKFANGFELTPDSFIEQSSTTLCFNAPAEGASGVMTFSNGADWELAWESPIEILAPVVENVSETHSDFGHSIRVTGKNLVQIDRVNFNGQVEAYKEIAADGKSMKVTVPADAKSGAVTASLKNGNAITLFDVILPEIAVTGITPDKNVSAGMELVVTGVNLDRVKAINWPGGVSMAYGNWSVSGDGSVLTVTVPKGIVDGVLTLVQNSNIAADTPQISTPKEGNTIWVGSIDFGNWSGSLEVAEEKADQNWTVFNEAVTTTGTLTFHFTQDASSTWWQFQPVYRLDWATGFEAYPSIIELEQGQTSLQIRVSQTDLDQLRNGNPGWVFKGCFITLESIEWQPDL